MTRYRRPVWGAATVLAAAAALAGAAVAETIRVEIKGLAFTPVAVTARVGDTIEWVNDDFVAHTATAQNGAWDVTLPPHASGRITLKAAGEVAYYCRYHPNMKGEVKITPR